MPESTSTPCWRRAGSFVLRVWPLLAMGLAANPGAAAAGPTAEAITTVAAVRALNTSQSAGQIPVHLRGVVTFFNEKLYSRFIQDETAGIYLQASIQTPPLLPGQVVDVEGVSDPGEYAPVVLPNRVRVVGTGPLPAAQPVSYEQLATGREDSQFVEVSGLVRTVRFQPDSQFYLIELATGSGRLSVYAPALPVARPEELPDSVVRVRGVCSTQFNHRRQLFAIRLMVPRGEDLVMESPAPADPFSIRPQPIGSLLEFTPRQSSGQRVKIQGTVTYFEPGRKLYVQSGNQAVEAQILDGEALVPGDQVAVLGFVGQSDYSPMLQDAIYQLTARGKPLNPERLGSREILGGKYDGQLVEVTARLLNRGQYGSERYLILQQENCVFQAYFGRTGEADPFAGLKDGSLVSAAGVCEIQPGEWLAGETWQAKSFRLLMRSASDVHLLEAPPWWTLRRVLWMAEALGLAMLVTLGWVLVLRRQVTERTRQLEIESRERQRAERKQEISQERARVAQDLHDDLGAGLTEVNMLCSLVKSSATTAAEKLRYLDDLAETSRRMVTSLDEIVWAINPRSDTLGSLASYFGAHAQRLLDLADVACGLDIADDLPACQLTPKFRQEIFLAFKEAITNVIRHAHATQVCLRIHVRENRLVVEVADNGHGFASDGQPSAGSDGLANMKERLKTLGGGCEIAVDTQTGTTVRFSAPLPEASP